MTDPTSHRRKNPWQFSVASLLALMTFVGFGLALFREYPTLAIAFFSAAGLIAVLLVADVFVSRASRQNWHTLIRFVWAFTIGIFISIIVLAVYAIGKAAGRF
jgi:hypothetical protein